jgi:hypothetical protein
MAIRRWAHWPALKTQALFIVLAELKHSHTIILLTKLVRTATKQYVVGGSLATEQTLDQGSLSVQLVTLHWGQTLLRGL